MNTIPIEQTVEIPASRRLVIEVPPEVPAGRTILTFTPAPAVEPPPRGLPDMLTVVTFGPADLVPRGAEEPSVRTPEAEREIELINRNTEWLNREMAEVLLDQGLDL